MSRVLGVIAKCPSFISPSAKLRTQLGGVSVIASQRDCAHYLAYSWQNNELDHVVALMLVKSKPRGYSTGADQLFGKPRIIIRSISILATSSYI